MKRKCKNALQGLESLFKACTAGYTVKLVFIPINNIIARMS